jgi:hypothetical protein
MATVGCESSSQEGEKQEGMTGNLTEGFMGWFDSEVRPATVKGERRRFALADKWLRTERNNEDCGKGWGGVRHLL